LHLDFVVILVHTNIVGDKCYGNWINILFCMCREISNHPEAYVRRSALFAASRILIALHPSFIATALSGGDHEISRQLEWIRNWALHVAEVDSDYECSVVCVLYQP
jgi:hypothetical protein